MTVLPFTITGTVIHGESLGNTYDSPTANIIPEQDVSGLERGVYFSELTMDKKTYPSITNLGVRPTVSDDGAVNAETYIYGLSEDIYEKDVQIHLLAFHRAERRFSSPDELFAAVREDFSAGALFHGLSS